MFRLRKNSILIFLMIYIFVFPIRIFYYFPFPQSVLTNLGIVTYIFLSIYGTWIYRLELKKNFQDLSNQPLASLGQTILLILGNFIINFIAMFIIVTMTQVFGIEIKPLQNDVNIGQMVEKTPMLMALISMGVAGPIVEELVFRKILIDSVNVRSKAYIIIVQAVLFALLHVHVFTLSEFISVLPHFGTGLLWGWIYHKSNNILKPIMVHSFFNIIAFLITFIL